MPHWLRKLMPQEAKFFPLFNEHAEQVAQAAAQLRERLAAQAPAGNDTLDAIVDKGGDTATRIQALLRSSFVTPFDRSDIKEMTASMQLLLEDIRSAARLGASAPGLALDEFAQWVVDCAGELRKGIADLEEFDKHVDDLRHMREAIGKLHRQSQARADEAAVRLFGGAGRAPADAVAALAGTRVLERLGRIVERFDEVADHIDDLVLDHV